MGPPPRGALHAGSARAPSTRCSLSSQRRALGSRCPSVTDFTATVTPSRCTARCTVVRAER
ncbi:MAG: hypothetical protein IPN17_35075 [Deltaproteobacteria bacterium]|nr:hypothetical protein [Deltaproteobacteria bacterium]